MSTPLSHTSWCPERFPLLLTQITQFCALTITLIFYLISGPWSFFTPIYHCQSNLSRISLLWCYYPAQKFLTPIHHLLKRFKYLSFVSIALGNQDPIHLSSLCYYPELLDRTLQFQLVRCTYVFPKPPCVSMPLYLFSCSWVLKVPSSLVSSLSPFFGCPNYNSVSLLSLSNYQNFWRMLSNSIKPFCCHLSPWLIFHPRKILTLSWSQLALSKLDSQAAAALQRQFCPRHVPRLYIVSHTVQLNSDYSIIVCKILHQA